MSGKRYTEKDDEIIRSKWKTTPIADIAAELNRSIPNLRRRATYLGVSKTVKWTPAKEKEILELSRDHTDREIAEMFGTKRSAISTKLHYLRKASGKSIKNNHWHGCERTCPDYCPYPECLMPTNLVRKANAEDGMQII